MTKEEIIKHLHKALNSVDITFPYRYVFVEAIEALSQPSPSLPSDIDEAAEKNFEAIEVLEHENIFEETHHKIFKAGAEWLAEHGIKLHGRILPGPKCNLYIESDCFDRGYKGLNYSFSDSNDVDMFIQIRKK